MSKILLLGPVDLLLEHPVVAVGDGLLQDGALLWVVADGRPPELLDVCEAVGQRRLRRQAQNEEASARHDHLVGV